MSVIHNTQKQESSLEEIQLNHYIQECEAWGKPHRLFTSDGDTKDTYCTWLFLFLGSNQKIQHK
jgi:hypothetical protein